MPIKPVEYVAQPFVRGINLPDVRTLADMIQQRGALEGQLAMGRGQSAANMWAGLAQAFQNYQNAVMQRQQQAIAQQRHAEELQMKRDEIAARTAERSEAQSLREEAQREKTQLAAEKRGDARAKAIGYGPMAEMDVDTVMQSPERAGDVRYAFGPGTANGPELMPTPEQQRTIALEKSVTEAGGIIGPNNSVHYPPKPAPKRPQPAMVNGKRAFVFFDDNGTATDMTGRPVEATPIAPAGDGGQRPLTQTAEAQIIQRLSSQWGASNKPMKDLERQVALMDTGMEAVKRGDLAQGAQMVLVTFQKILDPPSVVRESEFMRSAAGQSLINRVKGAYERLTKGGAGVTQEELQKFAGLAREAAMAQRKAAGLDRVRSRLSKTASRYNIPDELIFDDDSPIAGEPPPSGAGPTSAAPPPQVEEWDFDAKGNLVRKGKKG